MTLNVSYHTEEIPGMALAREDAQSWLILVFGIKTPEADRRIIGGRDDDGRVDRRSC